MRVTREGFRAIPMPAPLLELQNVTVSRGGRHVLSGLNLVIETGENVAILGPNGCGKSTLVKLICRELYAKPGGHCRILGKDRWNVWDLRATMGIVTNDLQLNLDQQLTALEVVLSGFSGHTGLAWRDDITVGQVADARDALRRVGAMHLIDRKLAELSSGEARRVIIARAVAHRPATLLFDEPTTSLDVVAADELLDSMRQLCAEGVQLILVTHHFDELIPEIGRTVLMRDGEIFADGPTQKVMTNETISAAFDREVALFGTGPYRIAIVDQRTTGANRSVAK